MMGPLWGFTPGKLVGQHVAPTHPPTTAGPPCAKHRDDEADQLSPDNSAPRAGAVRSVLVWPLGLPELAVSGWGMHGGPGGSERAPRGGRGQADFLEEVASCFLRRKCHAAQRERPAARVGEDAGGTAARSGCPSSQPRLPAAEFLGMAALGHPGRMPSLQM